METFFYIGVTCCAFWITPHLEAVLKSAKAYFDTRTEYLEWKMYGPDDDGDDDPESSAAPDLKIVRTDNVEPILHRSKAA